MPGRPHLLAAVPLLAAAFAAGGCGGSAQPPVQPSARLEHVAGSAREKIVLSLEGAQNIGLRTARAHGTPSSRRISGGPTVVVPSSALIYEPSGHTEAFVAVGRLTYSEVPVTVARIDGATAYLARGPRAGARVVSTGAEELYGVQTGVLGQK